MGPKPPTESFQLRCYRRLLQRMGSRPVTIRTMDLGGEKRFPGRRGEPEANPALGLRSIRFSFKVREMFLAQLRALLRASPFGRLKILFPMICCPEELREVKVLLEEARQQLRAKGQPFKERVEIGIMIEVPSAALLSAALARQVDFFSIGTNDLIQFTLAVDRHNEQVAYLYNPLCVAVLGLLKQVIDSAHAAKIPVSLCGEMAGDPLYLQILLGLGLDEISMNPPAIPFSRHIIRSSTIKDARALTERVLSMLDSQAIRTLVQEWMSSRFPEFFTSTGHDDLLGGL
jgi:phosphotransferase system enzyme I (PtsI)